jgi:hypothetical protein
MKMIIQARNRIELLTQIADLFNFTAPRKKFFVGCTNHYWPYGYINEDLLSLVHKYPWAMAYKNMNVALHDFIDRNLYLFKDNSFIINPDLINFKPYEIIFDMGITIPRKEIVIPEAPMKPSQYISEPIQEQKKINPRYSHLIK